MWAPVIGFLELFLFFLPILIMLDPKSDPRLVKAHEQAITRGNAGYIDPYTGWFVMTAASLKDRGYCCGKGCRHCPWPPDVQKKAGRPDS